MNNTVENQPPAIIRARVRGIYATAITKILVDEGIQIVQASDIIASRLGIPQLPLPADVTIKDGEEDKNLLLVIGYPEHTTRILEILQRHLHYSTYHPSTLELHSTIAVQLLGVRDGKCLGAYRDITVEVELDPDKCKEGETLKAYVTRPGLPGETPRVRPGIRVLGDYAILTRSTEEPRVSISKHIRSLEKRAELTALAGDYLQKGLSVHWRSSARHADTQELRSHLADLAAKLEELEKTTPDKPAKLTRGEKIVLVRLSYEDKLLLDQIRAKVTPTLPLHHTIKSTGDNTLSTILDYAETALAHGAPAQPLHRALLDKLAEMIRDTIEMIHFKPLENQEIRLGRAHVRAITTQDTTLALELVRRVRTPGVYDGLGVEKEPGDTIVTRVEQGRWYIVHEYYSPDGTLKGVYININTPPEITPTRITYIDLGVDIAKTQDKQAIIDLDYLQQLIETKTITRAMACKALATVLQLAPKAENSDKTRQLYQELCHDNKTNKL